uniref:NADH-ubiquinone oxidoreductase chain 5 n=1 Tax=Amyrsidea minuta TaxID=2364307 RepID=A0A386B2D6_9NEOP|nr:NADH dehydrogenase subunit 5 [Amyrsidea minuta]
MLLLMLTNKGMTVEFFFFTHSFNLSYLMLFDMYSITFFCTILVVYSSVYSFAKWYMEEDKHSKRFNILLGSFGASMVMLIFSGDLFSSLIAWDLLGVTSFLLIMYYFSFNSLQASVLAYLMNRVGDCFFMLTLSLAVMMSLNVSLNESVNYLHYIGLLLFLTSITKSAQIPFSTWLPAAMEAPTPVSALVHSSTLVTAGIYILFRYNTLWLENDKVCLLLSILSSSTLVMASLAAFMEMDLKKVIALSTLSQLGFIMFSFSKKLVIMGFFHLIIHAYYKALLFMIAGYLIHSSMNNQSLMIMNLKSNSPMLVLTFLCSSLSLCGSPFLSGFYSKDMILDLYQLGFSYIIPYVLIIMSFMMTVIYSFRMLWFLMNNSSNWNSLSDDVYNLYTTSSLFLFSCLYGSILSWLLIPPIFVIDNSKWLIVMFSILFTLALWVSSGKSKIDFLVKMWNLSYFNFLILSMIFKSSIAYVESSDLFSLPGKWNVSVYSKAWDVSNLTQQSNVGFLMLLHLSVMMFLTYLLMI